MYLKNASERYSNGFSLFKNTRPAGPKRFPDLTIADRPIEGREKKHSAGGAFLPILATANDLREVVRFFDGKPDGVSMLEIINAEPHRVFDSRKIAAYEFWGIIERDGDRLRRTSLGEELAASTRLERRIQRTILRSVPAYLHVIEWIYDRKLAIVSAFDVADCWKDTPGSNLISSENDDNIDAVIVSFFSICHAADLGTATVGKRGQPARLKIRADELASFINGRLEPANETVDSKSSSSRSSTAAPGARPNIARVYISSTKLSEQIGMLISALELADLTGIAGGEKPDEARGFFSPQQHRAFKQCQAAIFLLGDDDRIGGRDGSALAAERATEITVAQALFEDRIVVFWSGRDEPPDSLKSAGFRLIAGEEFSWASCVDLVKELKAMRS